MNKKTDLKRKKERSLGSVEAESTGVVALSCEVVVNTLGDRRTLHMRAWHRQGFCVEKPKDCGQDDLHPTGHHSKPSHPDK